jgi:hypothetical protein
VKATFPPMNGPGAPSDEEIDNMKAENMADLKLLANKDPILA